MLSAEFADMFGAMSSEVNSEFFHHNHRLRSNLRRMRARAENFKTLSGVSAQQTLCHLTAGGVARAKNQDSLLCHCTL